MNLLTLWVLGNSVNSSGHIDKELLAVLTGKGREIMAYDQFISY
ncbi:MAG: hypothetical protein CM1200mP30_16790 [Pseudomonadota bacterium]|nr:MAG: hypothetical protein CM1200mP30_16790 [Pseudomonadota bacterium]